jgi:manganese-dependent ADP-ribose/CDP-alcohol diphosphatase
MRPRLLPALLLALVGAVAPLRAERPLFSIGAVADSQYADEPDAPPRLYHTQPGKLAAAVADMNGHDLAFVVHLGDFIDRDWRSFDTVVPITDRARAPWRFVLGNHDFAVDDAHKPQVAARLHMPGRYYRFVRHGWMFIATDGNDLSSYGWPAGSLEHRRSMAVHAAL